VANRKTTKKSNSLVGNINKRKKARNSRSKKNSTVSEEAYREMKKGWPANKRKKAKKKKKS
jgi:hypothetical protein